MRATRRIRATLIVFLLCVLTSASALAQRRGQAQRSQTGPVTHSVRGRVYLPTGRPLEMAMRVTVRVTTGLTVQETFTSSGGSFVFSGLPSDKYELVVWGDDQFETVVEEFQVYGAFPREVGLNIVLREKEKREESKPKPGVVSVSELDRTIPKAAQQEYERGMKESNQGRHEQAITHFQRAIEKHDRYFQAHYELGLAHGKLGQLNRAQAAFTKAIAIEPGVALPYVNLGMIQLQQQAYEPAVATFLRAVELDGTNWRGHLGLGIGLLKAKQDEALAETELKKALALGQPPEVSLARIYLVNVYLRRGHRAEALGQAEAYLQEAPEAPNGQEIRDLIRRLRAQEPPVVPPRPDPE